MAAKSVEIAIVRHPQTVANVEGRFVGRGDSEITEHGRDQMMALTTAMELWKPTVVFASPLKRALITAQAITSCGIPINVLEDLQEIDFGRAEGLTWNEITALGMKIDYLRNGSADSADDLNGPGDGPVAPGGESWTDFEARVRRAAAAIEGAGTRVAIITHGGVFRTLLTHWLGLPMESSWRFSITNATIATLTLTDGAGVLKSLQPAAE
ncbi:MAG: histidine phosphatase family protein [Actinomycetota bacterium]|nr:MAG: 2 3-bisphosphoglycerate-dependent phosphoglycerate [Actinomycetota bacterium]MDO8950888.1 histidine phosphatase family protein [Actinomycetota bacterium]MDP3630141.1 histidine phosphatase family protein [Actinomycetota bacterium]